MEGKYILVYGSASLSCPQERLDRSVEFVRHFTAEVLRQGGGVVVLAGDERSTKDAEGNPHIFDWIVLREVLRHAETTMEPRRTYARVVMSDAAWESKIELGNQKILSTLQQRDVLELKRIPREEFTGGEYRSVQTEWSDGMVALGGGKGTYICGKGMVDLYKPMLPMDIDVGSRSEDGLGALALYREFVKFPEDFLPKTHELVADKIETLSLQSVNTEASVVARRAVELLGRELRCGERRGFLKSKPKIRMLWDRMSDLAKMAGIVRAIEIFKGYLS